MKAREFDLGGITVDAVAMGSQGNAILGIRDSGKTVTATGLAEHLFEAGIPFVAFDPIGVWRFMRVPGKGRGYPVVVAGGKAGDLPLTPKSAPEIVRAAMKAGVSLVIDLYDMSLSKADWKRIVADSVRVLLHENEPYGLRHVFLEEASEFVPQRPGIDSAIVYAEIEKLARMGGNARLGYTLINQRAEEVSKAVLELCDNLFLHRQKGRHSITALSKWLDIGNVKDHRVITDSLSTLPTGDCWAWMAGTDVPVRVHVPMKNSFHPDRRVIMGDVQAEAAKPVDADKFVERMRGLLKPVEPAPVQVAAQPCRAPPARPSVDVDAIRREAKDAGYVEGYQAGHAEGVRVERAVVLAVIEPLMRRLERLEEKSDTPKAPVQRIVHEPTDFGDLGQKITPTTRKILNVIARAYPVGLTFKAAAKRAGVSMRSSGLSTYRREVMASDEVEERDGRLVSRTAPPIDLTVENPIEAFAAGLPPSWAKMLRVFASGNGALSKPEVAVLSGISETSSGLGGGLSELVALELVERLPDGRFQLSEDLR